jgi:hypothetical protein
MYYALPRFNHADLKRPLLAKNPKGALGPVGLFQVSKFRPFALQAEPTGLFRAAWLDLALDIDRSSHRSSNPFHAL